MNNVLSEGELPVLRSFTSSDVLLAFDFDGTLAPIVDDPAQAYMTSNTRELLWQVSRRYPVIVLTGRAQPDALRRVRGVGALEVLGNHGIEPRHAANRFTQQVRQWRPVLDACAADWPGVWVEDKIYSVAVHYRVARDKEQALAAILETTAELQGARIIQGKAVVNVVPHDAPDKGVALAREQERLGCNTAIYVGDDQTDEQAFCLAETNRLLGIRVEPADDSRATHFIPDQAAIDDLLRVLYSLRRENEEQLRHRWPPPSPRS
jgi:trehalose 6-phosphate phosphatase